MDVYRVAHPVSTANAEAADLAAVMRQHRRNGRVPARINPRVKVGRPMVNASIARKQRNVGNLARRWRWGGMGSAWCFRCATGRHRPPVAELRQRVERALRGELVRLEPLVRTRIDSAAMQAGFRVT